MRKIVAATYFSFYFCAFSACSEPDIPKRAEALSVAKAAAEWNGAVQAADALPTAVSAEFLALTVKNSALRVVDLKFDVSYPVRNVEYVIARGGSLKDVANRFGIPHHVIVKINPQYELQQNLAAGTSVLVYDRQGPSYSAGTPSAGTLKDGVPMPNGPGRILRATRYKSWGSQTTVQSLDYILRQWAKRFPEADPVFVGNLSNPNGGKIEPHKSHQNGMDADLSFPTLRKENETLTWTKATPENLDCIHTWHLIMLIRESAAIDLIYVDYKLQKTLWECAADFAPDFVPKLRSLLQYPKSKSYPALIRHIDGHEDHLHVRFACAVYDKMCKSRK